MIRQFQPFVGELEDTFDFSDMVSEYTVDCVSCSKLLHFGEYFFDEFGCVVCYHGEFSDNWIDDQEHMKNSCYYTYHKCDHCGDLHEILHETSIKGIDFSGIYGPFYYCEDCIDSEDMVVCDDCNIYYPKDEIFTVGGRRMKNYCPNCLENNGFYFCSYCEEYHNDTLLGPNNEVVCTNCFDNRFYSCDRCNCVIEQRQSHSVEGNSYCDDCFSESFGVCEGCGETYDNDDLNYSSDGCYCNNCHCSNSNIHQYGYKPDPIFYGKDLASKEGRLFPAWKDLYSGIEIEVASKKRRDDDENAGDLCSHGKLFYCKEDTSIKDGDYRSGFEVISHPFSLEWYRTKGQAYFEHVWNLTDNYEEKAESCGMHVHLSRDAFVNEMHEYRYARFMYYRPNFDFMYLISGRVSEYKLKQWGKIDCGKEDITINELDRLGRTGFNRCPSNTREIRIFGSTLIKEEFEKNLEWCYAMFTYTADPSNNRPEYRYFLEWLGKYQDQFPVLCQFLNSNNYPVQLVARYDSSLTSYNPDLPISDLFRDNAADFRYDDVAPVVSTDPILHDDMTYDWIVNDMERVRDDRAIDIHRINVVNNLREFTRELARLTDNTLNTDDDIFVTTAKYNFAIELLSMQLLHQYNITRENHYKYNYGLFGTIDPRSYVVREKSRVSFTLYNDFLNDFSLDLEYYRAKFSYNVHLRSDYWQTQLNLDICSTSEEVYRLSAGRWYNVPTDQARQIRIQFQQEFLTIQRAITEISACV